MLWQPIIQSMLLESKLFMKVLRHTIHVLQRCFMKMYQSYICHLPVEGRWLLPPHTIAHPPLMAQYCHTLDIYIMPFFFQNQHTWIKLKSFRDNAPLVSGATVDKGKCVVLAKTNLQVLSKITRLQVSCKIVRLH